MTTHPKPKPVHRRAGMCSRCGGREHLPSSRCGFCARHDTLVPAPADYKEPTRILLAVASARLGGWGIGLLAEDAIAGMSKRWPPYHMPTGSVGTLWDCPRSAYVAQDGTIGFDPADKPPRKLKEITL